MRVLGRVSEVLLVLFRTGVSDKSNCRVVCFRCAAVCMFHTVTEIVQMNAVAMATFIHVRFRTIVILTKDSRIGGC